MDNNDRSGRYTTSSDPGSSAQDAADPGHCFRRAVGVALEAARAEELTEEAERRSRHVEALWLAARDQSAALRNVCDTLSATAAAAARLALQVCGAHSLREAYERHQGSEQVPTDPQHQPDTCHLGSYDSRNYGNASSTPHISLARFEQIVARGEKYTRDTNPPPQHRATQQRGQTAHQQGARRKGSIDERHPRQLDRDRRDHKRDIRRDSSSGSSRRDSFASSEYNISSILYDCSLHDLCSPATGGPPTTSGPSASGPPASGPPASGHPVITSANVEAESASGVSHSRVTRPTALHASAAFRSHVNQRSNPGSATDLSTSHVVHDAFVARRDSSRDARSPMSHQVQPGVSSAAPPAPHASGSEKFTVERFPASRTADHYRDALADSFDSHSSIPPLVEDVYQHQPRPAPDERAAPAAVVASTAGPTDGARRWSVKKSLRQFQIKLEQGIDPAAAGTARSGSGGTECDERSVFTEPGYAAGSGASPRSLLEKSSAWNYESDSDSDTEIEHILNRHKLAPSTGVCAVKAVERACVGGQQIAPSVGKRREAESVSPLLSDSERYCYAVTGDEAKAKKHIFTKSGSTSSEKIEPVQDNTGNNCNNPQ